MDKVKAAILGIFVIMILTGIVGETSRSVTVENEISFLTYEEYRQLNHGDTGLEHKQVNVQPLGFNS